MSHTYSTLTTEQQAQMVAQRLAQFEAEHYNHELNKIGLSTLPDSEAKAKALADSNAAQATIEAAIAALTPVLAHEPEPEA